MEETNGNFEEMMVKLAKIRPRNELEISFGNITARVKLLEESGVLTAVKEGKQESEEE